MLEESTLLGEQRLAARAVQPMYRRYLALLRVNPNFRCLWLAQLVSEIGDWFYSLAVYDLLLVTTHSGRSVSYAVILQTLPWFFMTPLAGHLVDRFRRRDLMILADMVRASVVLGLLFVRGPSWVWLVYALLGVEVVFASVFEPARNALLPNLVCPEHILPANALGSATWSVALTLGAAVGGLVTALLGRRVAFVVNSFSFVVSALLILRIQVRENHLEASTHRARSQDAAGTLASLGSGYRYLRHNPTVAVLALAKTGLGILGGSLVLLAIFGERVFPVRGRGALGVGLLYAARGVGAGLGPLIGDVLTRGLEKRMWKSITLGYLVIGCGYLLFSRTFSLAAGMLAICFAHIGGGTVWVMSTTLLQIHAEDRFRGRVFALDFGLVMLAVAASNFLLGLGLDNWGFSARQLAAGLGIVLLVPGVLWFGILARWKVK